MGVPTNSQLLAERNQLRSLAEERMNKRSAAPLGVYVFSSDEPGAELARSVEAEVFLDTFGNTPEQLAAEYSPYEGRTVFLCVIDHLRRVPAAAMRIIVPTADGRLCKTFDDMSRHWGMPLGGTTIRSGEPFDYSTAWDVATLAVAKDYQGKATAGIVSIALYEAGVRGMRESGFEYAVAILDHKAYRFAHWVFKEAWHPFDRVDAIPYLGSPASFPVWFQPAEWGPRLQIREPRLYEMIFDSGGYEGAIDLAPQGQLSALADQIRAGEKSRGAVIDLREELTIDLRERDDQRSPRT